MGTLPADRPLNQWASDQDFEGLRLEVLDARGDMVFDVSVPENGSMTINTFKHEVPADLVEAAIKMARERG